MGYSSESTGVQCYLQSNTCVCKIYGGYVPRGVLPCSKKETRIFHDSMVVREKMLKSPKENKFWLRFSHKGPLRDCYSDLSDKMPYRMEEKCLFLYTLA